MSGVADDRIRRWVAQLDARRSSLAAEVDDDVVPVRGLTLQERGEWIASACLSEWDILSRAMRRCAFATASSRTRARTVQAVTTVPGTPVGDTRFRRCRAPARRRSFATDESDR